MGGAFYFLVVGAPSPAPLYQDVPRIGEAWRGVAQRGVSGLLQVPAESSGSVLALGGCVLDSIEQRALGRAMRAGHGHGLAQHLLLTVFTTTRAAVWSLLEDSCRPSQ